MITNMHVGDTVCIQDSNKDGRARIGVGQCKDPSLVLIYGVNGMENCIVVTIIFVVLVFEQRKFFGPTQIGSSMGNDCFWHVRDVSMLEEKHVFLAKEGIQQKGLRNLWKRKLSCRYQAFASSLHSKGFDVNEKINNTMDGTPEDKSNGYRCNISNDATNVAF